MVDFLASLPHYADHLRPIHEAMGGSFYHIHEDGPRQKSVVVASYHDVRMARRHGYKNIALMQHGVGQAYTERHAGYSGGIDHKDVSLFLCPNEYSAEKWQSAYPKARVAVIGSPRVEHLPTQEGDEVAMSFHWLCSLWPETRPAFSHYRTHLTRLKPCIGHAHPRAKRWLEPWYSGNGIEYVPSFEEVSRRAGVFICDNSSALYEFAATGRPVVVLNAPWYRKQIQHGGRFWDWASVGVQVERPDDLVEAVRLAQADPDEIRQERERIVQQVFGRIIGSTAATVDELTAWAS
jgi:hypothetical protein